MTKFAKSSLTWNKRRHLAAGNRFKVEHGQIFDSHRCTGYTGFFLGNGQPFMPGIRTTAPDHRLSWLLVQEALVGLILCILCIDVH